MGSGGPATTTTTNKLPKWAQPFAKELLGAAGNQFLPGGQIRPMPADLQHQVAPFSPDQWQAMNMVEQMSGAPQTSPWYNNPMVGSGPGGTQPFNPTGSPSPSPMPPTGGPPKHHGGGGIGGGAGAGGGGFK